jgi:hypothetical protein
LNEHSGQATGKAIGQAYRYFIFMIFLIYFPDNTKLMRKKIQNLKGNIVNWCTQEENRAVCTGAKNIQDWFEGVADNLDKHLPGILVINSMTYRKYQRLFLNIYSFCLFFSLLQPMQKFSLLYRIFSTGL